MRRISVGLLALFLSTQLASAQSSTLPPLPKIGIEGTDNRVRTDPKQWPWISIGRVNREIGGHCTGTLIAAFLVPTPAHCPHHKEDGPWAAPFEGRFLAGFRPAPSSPHARGREFLPPPH